MACAHACLRAAASRAIVPFHPNARTHMRLSVTTALFNRTAQINFIFVLQVLFQPKASTEYDATAELSAKLADSDDAALPILSLELCGTGRTPRLAFDRLQVFLPAVPLGITSSASFRVMNDGYDNLDLKVRLPSDTENVPLEVEFPEGALIGLAKASIPVVVKCTAAKVAGFTANVEFLDQDGALQHVLRAVRCCINWTLRIACAPRAARQQVACRVRCACVLAAHRATTSESGNHAQLQQPLTLKASHNWRSHCTKQRACYANMPDTSDWLMQACATACQYPAQLTAAH